MHYLSLTKIYSTSILLISALLISFNSIAQNTPSRPIPTTPQSQQLPTQKIDPATISNQQAIDFYNQAKSSGMSDMDIENAAMQKGYTLDQISAMRKRLQLGGKETQEKESKRDELNESREQDKSDEEANGQNDTTGARRPVIRSSKTFGSDFFALASNTFEPNLRIATPRNYILGPEDEIIVDIYGNSVDNFKMKISPEGTVKMLNLAPVYVNGLTIEQASERIINRLRQAYSTLNRPGSGTYSSITLGDVRSIRVMIAGEAAKPGTYTVSSLATAFNALSLSGGPSKNGSYRNIEVIRNNNIIKKIDLYRFLVDADLKDNIALQDQDIILIRPYETKIELKGEVKRSGIFEGKTGEKISDLIKYAGGYTPDAYTSLLGYRRNTGTNYIIGSIDSTQLVTFTPQNGDIVYVRKILDVISNQVEIKGAVTIPGIYALEERCNSVLKLIKISQGLSARAFLNRAILQRQGGDTPAGVVAIDLRKLISGEITDIALQPGDVLTIKSIEDLKESPFLIISGSVINPGYFPFYQGITISDLIFQAGGFREEGIAYRLEVSRRVKGDTAGIPVSQNVKIFTLDIAENLKISLDDEKFKLMPYDVIQIRKSPRYEIQKIINVTGEVVYPGNYTILNNFERISDLLTKVGGLKPEANLSGARFYRNGELIAVDLRTVESTPSLPSNLLLMNNDSLVIPRRTEVVRINGGVLNPSLMNFDNGFSYSDYISQAGGYSENAWKSRVFVTYPNGRTHRTNKFLFFRSYPKIAPGSVINVPIKEVKAERQTSVSERVAIISLVTTLSLGVISLFR